MSRHQLVGSSLLSLAFAGGALDATSYLGLGRIFTANMTGNTVLVVTSVADGLDTHALRAATALGGFLIGAFAGGFLVPVDGERWPVQARSGLALELLTLTALLLAWAICGLRAIRFELIAAGGMVMGMQSAIALASDVIGVNTTYITGSVATALARLAQRARPHAASLEGPGLPGSAWITYGAGALAGAFAVSAWHAGAVALPLAMVAAVFLGACHQAGQLPTVQSAA